MIVEPLQDWPQKQIMLPANTSTSDLLLGTTQVEIGFQHTDRRFESRLRKFQICSLPFVTKNRLMKAPSKFAR